MYIHYTITMTRIATYAILLMNALVWVIDYYTPIRRFGTVKGGADQ